MKTLTAIAATALTVPPAFALAQDASNEGFSVTVSGGFIATPSFLGSGENYVFATRLAQCCRCPADFLNLA